jgi:hypothetical protein
MYSGNYGLHGGENKCKEYVSNLISDKLNKGDKEIAILERLKKRADTKQDSEIINFLLDVNIFHENPQMNKYSEIFDNYIKKESPNEINITNDTYRNIVSKFAEYKKNPFLFTENAKTIFDEAYSHVLVNFNQQLTENECQNLVASASETSSLERSNSSDDSIHSNESSNSSKKGSLAKLAKKASSIFKN